MAIIKLAQRVIKIKNKNMTQAVPRIIFKIITKICIIQNKNDQCWKRTETYSIWMLPRHHALEKIISTLENIFCYELFYIHPSTIFYFIFYIDGFTEERGTNPASILVPQSFHKVAGKNNCIPFRSNSSAIKRKANRNLLFLEKPINRRAFSWKKSCTLAASVSRATLVFRVLHGNASRENTRPRVVGSGSWISIPSCSFHPARPKLGYRSPPTP